MNDIATINIDKKTVEGIVERQMQAAIVGQLDAVKDDLMAKMVDQMLNNKVDDRGNLVARDHWSGTPMLEYLAKNKIRQMAENAINKFFEGNAESIEKVVLKEITKQQKSIVKAAVASIQNSMSSQLKWNVKIEVQEGK